MIRRLSRAIGALLILGLCSPAVALADQISAVPDTAIVASAPVAGAADAPADIAAGGPLSDVPLNSWAYDAVNQLAKDGIIKGYPDGTFKGQRPMTRYEAAVMAYRAVDYIEAQITAGKAVDAKLRSDMDAANKLLAAYGTELKAVERHVDDLQKEADATKAAEAADKTAIGRQQGQIGALQDFNRRAFIKFNMFVRQFAYGANVNANCDPRGLIQASGGATSVATYCNHTGAGNALLPGVRTASYGTGLGSGSGSSFPNGQSVHGEAYDYYKVSITGTPAKNTAFVFEMSNATRPVSNQGSSSTTNVCQPTQNFVATNCAGQTGGTSAYNDGGTGFLSGGNNVWIQQSIPNSGIYLRAGHVQNNEGPSGGGFLGGDYYWGAIFGITKGPFNAYLGYGVGNGAIVNAALANIPFSHQKFTAEADYSIPVGAGILNVEGMYTNYTGGPDLMWDPSAVMCTGNTAATNGATRYYANTAAVPFTACGAGFTPISYANGATVTGAYLSAAANNPTVNTTGGNFTTPGLAVGQPVSWVGGHLQYSVGKWRAYVAGTMHLGNDPYTGSAWAQNLAGEVILNYGPYKPGRGNRGQFAVQAQGYAIQLNAQTANVNVVGSPSLDNSWSTNFSNQYWVEADVKYWTSDATWFTLGYGRAGLLPNTLIPASGPTCPGCVISGFGQNAAFMEFQLNI